ncbi:MAG: multidrug efflux SMR transporter [Smithellaceae bacterium]|nr:multidrug efflux SMR transporter [Smithellaceae bacterium]
MTKYYLYLLLAIFSEVVATTSLKATESFTKLVPSLIVVVGYMIAFLFLSICLERITVGVAYAIWSGVGIILVALAGFVFYRQSLDAPAVVGMALIVAGVVVMNLFSGSIVH